MPLNQRSTALSSAVLAFFAVSIIAAVYKSTPLTCCKRGIIAMLVAYFFVSIIVKIINAVILDAMISKQVDKRIKGRNTNAGTR